MKKAPKKRDSDEMLEEYDFRGAVRGKYARAFSKGIKVVILEPDVARVFPDSKSVTKPCVPAPPSSRVEPSESQKLGALWMSFASNVFR